MNLSNLKQLTTLQRDECKDRAIKRVQRNIGDKPTRKQFQRELGRLWTVLDILAIVVFIPALLISSIHIVTHMGPQSAVAFASLVQPRFGTAVEPDVYIAAHQWLYIPMAEGSMILFLVMFGVSRDGWRRWVFFILACLAVLFVLVSNLSSGLGLLESALVPAFTIGIGLKLEHLIMQYLKRGHEVTQKYLAALAIWEAATKDATAHPDYKPMLANELWTALIKPKGNQWAMEAPGAFKVAAVQREMSHERWAYEDVKPVAEFTPPAEEVEPREVAIPFGSTVPTVDESASMPLMHSANGHTVSVNEN